MFFLLGLWNGLGEIRAHKLRSLLTVTCVLLGVASIVLIAAFITGLFHTWEVYSQEMGGAQKVMVDEWTVPQEQQGLASLSPGRTLADARAVTRFSGYARYVCPEVELQGTLSYKDNTADEIRKRGVTAAVLAVDRYEVARGRFITDLDLQRAEPVIVLGSSAAKALFAGREDPLGKVVQIDRTPFRVVGLLKHYEMKNGNFNFLERKNQVVFLPITAVQRRATGNDQLTELALQVDDLRDLARLVDEVNSILTRTHRGVRDFKVQTRAEGLESFHAMRRNFFLVGCGIATVTLLVGGIGIMNLMLASINERVREIGIRKAVGAWNRDIFVQFLAEAVTLSCTGGVLGVGIGVLVVRLLRRAMAGGMASPPIMSVPAVLVGLTFSVVVGIIAGLYPALRASRLDPIEALRYE